MLHTILIAFLLILTVGMLSRDVEELRWLYDEIQHHQMLNVLFSCVFQITKKWMPAQEDTEYKIRFIPRFAIFCCRYSRITKNQVTTPLILAATKLDLIGTFLYLDFPNI